MWFSYYFDYGTRKPFWDLGDKICGFLDLPLNILTDKIDPKLQKTVSVGSFCQSADIMSLPI